MTVTIDDAATIWSASPSDRAGRPVILLLHGYGSNEADLFQLAPGLPLGPVLASLRAPLPAPWPVDGWAWFPLADPGTPDPDAVNAAARAVLDWLDSQLDPDVPVGTLGFSQGGALALQLLRLAPQRFAFAANLSGFVAPGTLPGDAELAESRPAVFWGRGTDDAVIAENAITRTTEWLPGHSTLSGRIYEGLAHQISAQELADVSGFIERSLRA